VFSFIILNLNLTSTTTVPREEYARSINADYHKRVDGKSKEEKATNLEEIQVWAASREEVVDEKLSLKSVTTRITSIRDKFTGLVCILVIHADNATKKS
jgi:hypothetical protein